MRCDERRYGVGDDATLLAGGRAEGCPQGGAHRS